MAEAHGISKRIIENEYTLYDYHVYTLRKNRASEIEKLYYEFKKDG